MNNTNNNRKECCENCNKVEGEYFEIINYCQSPDCPCHTSTDTSEKEYTCIYCGTTYTGKECTKGCKGYTPRPPTSEKEYKCPKCGTDYSILRSLEYNKLTCSNCDLKEEKQTVQFPQPIQSSWEESFYKKFPILTGAEIATEYQFGKEGNHHYIHIRGLLPYIKNLLETEHKKWIANK